MAKLGFEQLMFLLRDSETTHPVIHCKHNQFDIQLDDSVECEFDLSDWQHALRGLLDGSRSVHLSGLKSFSGVVIELDTMGFAASNYSVMVLKELDLCIFGSGLDDELVEGGAFDRTRDELWHYIESFPNYNWFKHDSVSNEDWEEYVKATPEAISAMHNGATDARLTGWIERADQHMACSGYAYVAYDENEVQSGTIGERLNSSKLWQSSGLTKTDGVLVELSIKSIEHYGYTGFLLSALDLVILFTDSDEGWLYCSEMTHEGFFEWMNKLPNPKSDKAVNLSFCDHHSDVAKGYKSLLSTMRSHSALSVMSHAATDGEHLKTPYGLINLYPLKLDEDELDVAVTTLEYYIREGFQKYKVLAFKSVDLVALHHESYFMDQLDSSQVVSTMSRKDFLGFLDTIPNHWCPTDNLPKFIKPAS